MPTDAKRQAIAELVELLRSSSALAVADYRGLKVSEMQSVRRSLRARPPAHLHLSLHSAGIYGLTFWMSAMSFRIQSLTMVSTSRPFWSATFRRKAATSGSRYTGRSSRAAG